MSNILSPRVGAALRSAAAEIRELRRSNEVMAARLKVYDEMMVLFKSQPSFERVEVSEDIAWEIDKILRINIVEDIDSNKE